MPGRLGLSFGIIARGFRQDSLAYKAYAVAQLCGPVGVGLVAAGVTRRDHPLFDLGLMLLGVVLVDALVLFPIIRVRSDLGGANARWGSR